MAAHWIRNARTPTRHTRFQSNLSNCSDFRALTRLSSNCGNGNPLTVFLCWRICTVKNIHIPKYHSKFWFPPKFCGCHGLDWVKPDRQIILTHITSIAWALALHKKNPQKTNRQKTQHIWKLFLKWLFLSGFISPQALAQMTPNLGH